MSHEKNGAHEEAADVPSPRTRQHTNTRSDWRDKVGIPEPIKRVFRKFPLVTYDANNLPITSPAHRNEHTLWLWTTPEGAATGALSFNPSCLKWQTYLKFRNIPFRTYPSNNHASPSGSLPFLFPADFSPSANQILSPVPSSKLRTWASEQNSMKDDDLPLRAETYTALIDHRIRRAWLYTLYLDESNFDAVAKPLYILSSSSNPVVNAAIAYQLRKAAQDELVKANAHVDAEELLADAREAFEALAVLLKEDEWFFGASGPGLFDASVFAYTHLLLDQRMGWKRNDLAEVLMGYENLVRHRERVLSGYFA